MACGQQVTVQPNAVAAQLCGKCLIAWIAVAVLAFIVLTRRR